MPLAYKVLLLHQGHREAVFRHGIQEAARARPRQGQGSVIVTGRRRCAMYEE